MTRIIHEHRGTIDKYVGDMIMAFWSTARADRQHARHALEAAMAMVAALLAEDFRRSGLPQVEAGIGINTGTMNVGKHGLRIPHGLHGDR